MNEGAARLRPGGGGILTLGFATATAMWAAGYVTHLPGLAAPGWLVLVLLLACLGGGGFAVARLAGGAPRDGAATGLLASTVNLLILGSLLGDPSSPGILPSALLWLPGSLAAGALAGALGALLAGRRAVPPPSPGPDWPAAFASVTAAATLLLLIAGGIVTGHEAGLAVVDWPNSFGYNMFLYPLSRMTGGVYYEHAHRLFGTLVGLSTVVLAVFVHRADDRRWLKNAALAAVALVVLQGVLGGLRVTGRFTMSDSPLDTRPSLVLAVVHGVLGQLFLGTVTALAVLGSRAWRRAAPAVHRAAPAERGLSRLLVFLLIVQLVFGAVLRHVAGGLLVHVAMAVVVAAAALLVGVRAWGDAAGLAARDRLGRALMILIGVQFALGLAALWATGVTARLAEPATIDVVITTAHQTCGALLLAAAVALTTWNNKLIRPSA